MCVCVVPAVTRNFCKSIPGKVRNCWGWAVTTELAEKALLVYPFFIKYCCMSEYLELFL